MEDYTAEELRSLMVECHQYDGSFDYLYCYELCDINDFLDGLEPQRIMNMVFFGNYNPNCDYFRFDGYGNIESVHAVDYLDEVKEREEEILEHAKELGIIEEVTQ